MLETTPPTGGGAKQPKTLAAWHPCALALILLRFRHHPRASVGYPESGFITYARLRLPSACGSKRPRKTFWKSSALENAWSMRDRHSPSDTRSFAFLLSAFCFPCP